MKRTILSCMPLIPMVMHWLLPIGIENSMYINIGGVIPFFVFNICFLVYILSYRKLIKIDLVTIPNRAKRITIIFAFIYLLYSLLHGWAVGIDGLLIQMLNNQALVFALLLFMLYPMNRDMIERTKYIVLPTAVLLSLEVILYSLGILQYSVDLGTNVSAGVLRISTTIGAATGTAVVLVMLGVMILYYVNIKIQYRFALVILITISIFLLQSRGSVGVWGIFVSYFIYVNYLKNVSLKNKIRIIFLSLLSIICFSKLGVFDPILERQKSLMEDNNINTGRDGLRDKALNVFSESGGFGIGIGQTNYEKSLNLVNVQRSNSIGVHNHYICVLAELGIIGLSLLLIYLFNMLKFLDFKQPISLYILLLFLLTFCTEPIFLLSEFTYPASFLLMISISKFKI